MFNVYVTTVQLHLLYTYHSHSVYSTSHSPPPSLPRDAQAIDSYEAQGDGQVSFEEGDIIQVLDKIEDGKSLLKPCTSEKIKDGVGADSLPQKEMWNNINTYARSSGCYVYIKSKSEKIFSFPIVQL